MVQSVTSRSTEVSVVPEVCTLLLTSRPSKRGFSIHLPFLNLNKQALGSPLGPLILRHLLTLPLPMLHPTLVAVCEEVALVLV
jgi:hypothetical protein